MNILILNWRDIKNPQSGGAEILTHEIAKRLKTKNNTVIQFSSEFANSKKTEIIDGIKIIREGHPDLRMGFNSVHFRAFLAYKKKKFGKVDVVIDEIHGVPFFTPFYVKEERVALICEYAGDLWDKAVKFPFNILGKFVERLYPFVYKKTKIVTISDSSRKEIKKYLFFNQNISVVHPGCTTKIIHKVSDKKILQSLTLVFVARLTKSKGIEDALRAVKILKEKFPNIEFHVVGRGKKEYVGYIKKIITKLDLQKNVFTYGYVSESKKIQIIDKSHFIVIPSQKEGWGLTVHEANSRGVPAVGYNIPGLKDVIKDKINGVLTEKNNPENIAKEILTIFTNQKLYNKLSTTSILERRRYTWEKTVEEFLKTLS